MKHKKRWIIVISLIVIFIIAGVGGKKYMDYKHEQEAETQKYQNQEISSAEKAIAEDLKKYYDVKEIRFTGWFRNESTGMVTILVNVNNDYNFNYYVSKNAEQKYIVESYGEGDNLPEDQLKKGVNENDIKIIFNTKEEK